jgi:hypothetical protein
MPNFVPKNIVTVYLPKECACNICSYSIRPKYLLLENKLRRFCDGRLKVGIWDDHAIL